MVSRNLNEYLQMDLITMHAITSIKTQGRFGKGQGQEFSEAYIVEYWRPSFGSKWRRWKNIQGKEVSSINSFFNKQLIKNLNEHEKCNHL
jgi:discoidin domain receptor family member 2